MELSGHPILDPTVHPLKNSPNKVIQPKNLHGWKYYDPDEDTPIPGLEEAYSEKGDNDNEQSQLRKR